MVARFLPDLGDHPLQQALSRMRSKMCGLAGAAFLLCFSLRASSPPPPPRRVQHLSRPEVLLEYLQKYQSAIARNNDVLFWFLFMFVFWFLTDLISLSREAARLVDAASEAEERETSRVGAHQ